MKEIILNFYLNQNSEFCLKSFFRVPLHFRSFTLSTWQFSRKTTTNAKQWPNRSSKFWRISKIKSPNVKKGERLHSKIEKIVSSNYSFQATFFKKKNFDACSQIRTSNVKTTCNSVKSTRHFSKEKSQTQNSSINFKQSFQNFLRHYKNLSRNVIKSQIRVEKQLTDWNFREIICFLIFYLECSTLQRAITILNKT